MSTRPRDKNGLGLTTQEALLELRNIETLFAMAVDVQAVYTLWRDLVVQYNVRGVAVHDARLVAVCIAHGVSHILTFNDKDFKRYGQIIAVHPQHVFSS